MKAMHETIDRRAVKGGRQVRSLASPTGSVINTRGIVWVHVRRWPQSTVVDCTFNFD
jgi:hypothetical protein